MAKRAAKKTTLETARAQLAGHLERKGMKHTRQRDAILEVFVHLSGHVTSEQLYELVREKEPEIGAATVYRTLKLFCDAGVAQQRHFRDGITLYEYEEHHHDHLICVGCNEIIEFECPPIEQEQTRIAERHGYRLTSHRHHLYGLCPRCQREGPATS